VYARDGVGAQTDRHSSGGPGAPGGLTINRHDISIPDERHTRATYAPFSDAALSDIGIRSPFRKIGGVRLVLNDILKFDVEGRCLRLPMGQTATYRAE
jgi:hypothetical protein